jgi:hypothetical protein
MEISLDKFIPRKRRAVKVKEQLDDIFLRRSKRTALKLHGFEKVLIHSHTCVHNTHIEHCTQTSHTHAHTHTEAEDSHQRQGVVLDEDDDGRANEYEYHRPATHYKWQGDACADRPCQGWGSRQTADMETGSWPRWSCGVGTSQAGDKARVLEIGVARTCVGLGMTALWPHARSVQGGHG